MSNLDGHTVPIPGLDWNKTAVYYMELDKQKTEVIERVRNLHKLVTYDNAACGDLDCCGEWEEYEVCADCNCDYPCPTIKILDGEEDEDEVV